MIALLASFLIATNAPAAEVIASCRAMIPADVKIEGRVILRNRKGIVQLEKNYTLTREKGETKIDVDDETLAKTDVTKDDLRLAYLWWPEVADDVERTGETVHGQECRVIDLKSGERLVKAWIDCRTGALMQAEEHKDGKAVRRLWGTRVKKFGERWMANVMEVETLGSGHRTKITVEKLNEKAD